MERAVIEYIANSLWQVPLFAGAAWLVLHIVRAAPIVQHRVWLAVLAAAVLLPVHGMELGGTALVPRRTEFPVPTAKASNAKSSAIAHETAAARPFTLWTHLAVETRRPRLTAARGNWLLEIYLAIVCFGALRLARGLVAARRLEKDSRRIMLSGKAAEMFLSCSEKLGVGLPQLRESNSLLTPAVVGVWTPVLLLPKDFLLHTRNEIEAALCHELAHIQRRDSLINLLCQIVALPLIWHPAIYMVQRRIRNTREMACDAMAAEQMQSETGYARCLVALAQGMVYRTGSGQTQTLGLFDSNRLEERIMWLTKTKTVMSARKKAVHMACGAAVMGAALTMAMVFHVTPILAQTLAKPSAPTAGQGKAVGPQGGFGIPGLTAIQHGKSEIVLNRKSDKGKGEYTHRWKGADGEPFAIVNDERQEPTREEQLRIEKEFERRMAKTKIELKGLDLPDIQQQVKDATAQLDSPEFKKQMAELQKRLKNGELQRSAQMAALTAELKREELQRSMDLGGTANELKALKLPTLPNMSDIQKQMRDATAQIDSRELQQEMAQVQRAVKNGELRREQAIEILKDAQKKLENETAK